MEASIQQFWEAFLRHSGIPAGTEYYEAFHFGNSAELANALLELVLAGKKTATTSSVRAIELEGKRLPRPGDFSIVTDWNGRPACVIETTAVLVLPFKDVTYEICRREGEDDHLESWQAGHQRFFEKEARQLGYDFTRDTPIVFEDFRVVYPPEVVRV